MTRLIAVCLASAAILLATIVCPTVRAADAQRPPNFVIIYIDDMGYADVGCYGSKTPTPNIDRMAKDGVRFTSFYVPQGICSASRAALMTGCYPNRIGIHGALGPQSPVGINDHELTIAQILKTRGYATAIFGKWHLGRPEPFLPTHHGFDEYLGLPYSNDMGPSDRFPNWPPLPLIEGTKVIEYCPSIDKLTTLYTQQATKFIDAHKEGPFFLYVPHAMVHVPLGVSEKFAGKSFNKFADVVREVDWSVGQILECLNKNHLDENTLVFFASDNGPWLRYGDHAGSAGPLREGKATTFEGGVRVPGIFRWTGHIAPGRETSEPGMTIDIMPTLAKLAGAAVPNDRIIDGHDLMPLLTGSADSKSPHDVIYFWWNDELQAIRSGKWKLHFPHDYRSVPHPGMGGKIGPDVKAHIELSLFDLESDVGESKNVAAEHPDVVKRLSDLAEPAREDLGDTLTNRVGKNVRPAGKFDPKAKS